MADATTHAHHGRSVQVTPATLARLRSLSAARHTPRDLVASATRAELVALGGLVALVVAIALMYSNWILPGQVRRLELARTRDQNAEQIETLRREVSVDPEVRRTELEAVKASLEQFRTASLKPRLAGRLAIVTKIEELTRKTGVRLASTVSFRTARPGTDVEVDGNRVAKSKPAPGALTSFPSLAVSYQVSGTYAQLRQFVSAFEQSPQFVVFNSISLSTADAGEQAVEPGFGGPVGRGPGRGSDVNAPLTLDISMTAYFQPELEGAFHALDAADPASIPEP